MKSDRTKQGDSLLAPGSRGLTLTQPWAAAVAIGVKAIETRSWPTRYRGPVAIHSAKGMPRSARDLCVEEPFASVLGYGPWTPERDETHARVLPWLGRGYIVATAVLAHCLPIFGFDDELMPGPTARFGGWPEDEDPEDEESLAREGWWLDMGIPVMHPNQAPFGHFAEGRFAWFLEDVRPLEAPIGCKGALGLWSVERALGVAA